MGTPTEDLWPGVSQFSEWKQFPMYPCQDVGLNVLRLGSSAVDLLQRFLQYQPNLRISASDAMKHIFFKDYFNRLQQHQ
jgi:hypothetical protein